MGGVPDGGFGVGGGIVGEGEGSGRFSGEGSAADGGAFKGEEFEGGTAVVVEALAKAGVFDGEGFVFLFEDECAVLGLEDEVTDRAFVVAGEGSLDLHQLVHERGGIHWGTLRGRDWG